MFFDRLSKLLGNLFHAQPKYISVSATSLNAGTVQALPPSRLPRHVAIIMDGNGRWAKGRGLPRSAGHAAGTEALRDIIRASDDWGIEVLSIYAFSTENWARSKEEVNALMGLLLKYFASEIDELDEKHVRITILGDVDGLPGPQREAVIKAMERTRDNTGLKLNIALNYGGRAELVRAARLLSEAVKNGELSPEDIDEAAFEDRLYTAGCPDVDLLIRTSGEMRTSNFLPWQLTYAEMVFDSVNWPDFDRNHYMRCLRAYADRDRRFGGVDEASEGEKPEKTDAAQAHSAAEAAAQAEEAAPDSDGERDAVVAPAAEEGASVPEAEAKSRADAVDAPVADEPPVAADDAESPESDPAEEGVNEEETL